MESGRDSTPWFGVRCLFQHSDPGAATGVLYEERVTLWRAPSAEEAIARAEAEAASYAADLGTPK